jgi:two-component system, NarL family, sensor histidine kinase DegS
MSKTISGNSFPSSQSRRYRSISEAPTLTGRFGPLDSGYRLTLQQHLNNSPKKSSHARALDKTSLQDYLNLKLRTEVNLRRAAECSLKKQERKFTRLLHNARRMQQELQHLSRKILIAQEDERKRISRELHDEVAQTLTVVGLELASLQVAAAQGRPIFQKIDEARSLLEISARQVHHFARELRPPLLDDAGLIPALESFIKALGDRMRISIYFQACPEVEQLNHDKKIILYRVVQAALTNVGVHAQAKRAEVSFTLLPCAIRVEIRDNGKSFSVDRVLGARHHNRLGIVGMRERVEMVGGQFRIISRPKYGTSVLCTIPLADSLS